jgi:SAM-dependent methyltransferase
MTSAPSPTCQMVRASFPSSSTCCWSVVNESRPTLLQVIDRFASSPSRLSVLEVGGAPGGYLVHVWRKFGHDVCVLDNSPVGTELSRRNFELLGVPGRVLERDLFAPDDPELKFDLVFSLGLIEHFQDTTAVVDAHLSYVRPGGTVIVGCPNFRRINGWLLQRLSPSLLRWHNLDAMDISRWPEFERRLNLDVKFRSYVAGFQPGMFWRCERRSITARATARGLSELGQRMPDGIEKALSRLNSSLWSYYALGAYGKRAVDAAGEGQAVCARRRCPPNVAPGDCGSRPSPGLTLCSVSVHPHGRP